MSRHARELLVVATLLLVVALAQLLVLVPGHPWGGDFSQYIHHSVNLLQGKSYGDTGYLFNPAHPNVGPPHYPPGLPLMFVPVIAVWGVNFTVLKLVILVSSVAVVAMVYLCFRRDLPLGYLVALLAIVGLNQHALADVNSIGSDVPFMAILYLAIFVIRTAYDTPARQPPRQELLLLAAVLMYCSYATRTLGVVLLPSLLAYDLIRYRRITRWAMTAGGLFIVLVLVQRLLLQSERGYLDEYRGVGLDLFLYQAYLYATKFAAYWHNGYFPALAAALFAAIAAFAILGYVTSVRPQVTLFEIFPVLYVCAVLAFPGYQGLRYLMPIMPFVVLFAFRGLRHPWLTARPRLQRLVAGTLLVAIGGSYLAAYTSRDFGTREGIAKPESVALFDFVRQQTETDDVIVFVKPRVMALLTDRDSSTFHTPADDRALWEYFRRIGATHLVEVVNDAAFENYEPQPRLVWMRQFVDRSDGRLQRVFENRDFRLHRIVPQVPDAVAQATRQADSASRLVESSLLEYSGQ